MYVVCAAVGAALSACSDGAAAVADARPELRLAAPPARGAVEVVSPAERRGAVAPARRDDAPPPAPRVSRPRRTPEPARAPRVPAVTAVAAAAPAPVRPVAAATMATPVALLAPPARAAAVDLSMAGAADGASHGAGQGAPEDPAAPTGVRGVGLPQAGGGVTPDSCIVAPDAKPRGGLGALVRDAIGRGNTEGDPRVGRPAGGWGGRRPF